MAGRFPSDAGVAVRDGDLHFVGGWLDNMAPAGTRAFTLEGVDWHSVEHWFQAHKHPGREGQARVQQIRAAMLPQEAKRCSFLPGGNFDPAQWEAVKVAVMYAGVRGKFSDPRNADMREWLLGTRGLRIVEHCPDAVWGDGARRPDAPSTRMSTCAHAPGHMPTHCLRACPGARAYACLRAHRFDAPTGAGANLLGLCLTALRMEAYTVMAYTVMAHIVMAYVAMAHIVMAYRAGANLLGHISYGILVMAY